MKLLWHIVWKDARRLRWPLAAWAGLIVVQLLIGAWLAASAGITLETFKRFVGLQSLLSSVQLFAAYLLAGWLVHEDLVVGVQVHWITLPVSGRRLLAAKLAALGLFLWLMPAMLALPWWLACGFGFPVIAGLMGQTIVLHAMVTLPALLVAALTDNWTRFFTWSLVLVVAVVTGAMATMARMNLGYVSLANGVWQSRVVLVIFIWLLTIVGVTVHQFLTRRTGRSIGIVATGVISAVAVLGGWSHDLSPGLRRLVAPRDAPRWHNAVVVEAGTGESASRVELQRNGSEREAALRLRLKIAVDDLAGREAPGFVDLEAEWRWPDGVSLKRHTTLWSQDDVLFAPNAALVDPRGAARARREFVWGCYVSDIPPSLAAKMLNDPPTLHGRLAFTVYRQEIAGECSLAPGSRRADGTRSIRVGSAKPTGPGMIDVAAVAVRPWFLGDTLRFGSLGLGRLVDLQDWLGIRQGVFVAVNRGAHDAMGQDDSLGWTHSSSNFSTVIFGVEISWQHLTISPPRQRKPEYRGVSFRDLREKYGLKHVMDAYEPPDPHWLDGARLLSLTATPVGRLETTFTIERFEVKEEQRQGSP
jgi:hypothetical protein